jgi:hypothetical protein
MMSFARDTGRFASSLLLLLGRSCDGLFTKNFACRHEPTNPAKLALNINLLDA